MTQMSHDSFHLDLGLITPFVLAKPHSSSSTYSCSSRRVLAIELGNSALPMILPPLFCKCFSVLEAHQGKTPLRPCMLACMPAWRDGEPGRRLWVDPAFPGDDGGDGGLRGHRHAHMVEQACDAWLMASSQ